jgi:hypothetical protein
MPRLKRFIDPFGKERELDLKDIRHNYGLSYSEARIFLTLNIMQYTLQLILEALQGKGGD